MEDLALVATVPVAKKKATFKTGPKKGKLRPGCRFKGRKAYCTPEVASRLGTATKKAKHRGARGPIIAKTPEGAERQRVFQALLEARKFLKVAREQGNCGQVRHSAQKIASALNYMSRLPVKKTKSNPMANPAIRNARYAKELERIKGDVLTCSRPDRAAASASNAAARAQYEAFMASRGQTSGLSSGWKFASKATCLRKDGRLKKNCKHAGNGKFLKKVG